MIKVLINKGMLCKFLIIGLLCALLMVAVNITSFDELTAEQAFLAARDGFIELEEREFSAEPIMCSLWFLLFVPFVVQILTEDYEIAKSFVFIRLKSVGKWYDYKMMQAIFYSLLAAFAYNFFLAVIAVLSGYEIDSLYVLCAYTLYGTLSGALFLLFFVDLTYVMTFKIPSHISTGITLFIITGMMISITFIGNDSILQYFLITNYFISWHMEVSDNIQMYSHPVWVYYMAILILIAVIYFSGRKIIKKSDHL